MKNIFFSFFVLCMPVILCQDTKKAMVTYDFSGGRFGDNLISYLHAKWQAFSYNIPLLYKPFKYSDQLVLSKEELLIADYESSYSSVYKLTQQNCNIDPNRNFLYVVPYFSEVEYERNLPWNQKNWIYFPVDWKNQDFLREIRSKIKPLNEDLLHVDHPKDRVTVAVHVRKGGGYDEGALLSEANEKKIGVNYLDYNDPFRFPPEYYYVDQIKKVSLLFQHEPLYVFIFTDDPHPEVIAQRFKEKLQGYDNIVFDYRRKGNAHDANVVEDFFAMTTFQCLIRPQSNFSLVAGLIGDFLIEIFPVKHHWEGTVSVFDEIQIIDKRPQNSVRGCS